MPELDPRNHIDRHAEQELFRQLASFESAARILTISDRGGWGKSSLLKKLRYNCQYELRPRPACCLVELDKIADPSPFSLVSTIVHQLDRVEGASERQRFASFTELDTARVFGDVARFEGSPAHGSRSVGMARVGSMASGAVAAGNYVRHAEKVELTEARRELTQEQDRVARMRCCDAFFDDLRTVCSDQPVVLLFDAWERCNGQLREWIRDVLFRDHILHPEPSRRPDKLGIVLAGRPYELGQTPDGIRSDDFDIFFDDTQTRDTCVLSIASLSEWETEHVSEFMVLNGLRKPDPEEIRFIQFKLRSGWSLEKLRDMVKRFADENEEVL